IGGRLSAALHDTAPLFVMGAIIFGLSFLLVLTVNSHAPHLNYAKQRDHSLRQQLMRLRPLTPTYLRLFFVFFAAIIGTILPANFLGTLGWNIAEVNSLAGTATAVGALVLSLALGRLAAGRRRRGLLLGQTLLFLSMAFFIGSTSELRVLSIAAYFLLGALPTLRELTNAQLAGQVDHDMRGTALGLNETIFALARSLAALLAGSLFALDPRAPFIAAIGLIPIGLVLIVRQRPPVTREEFVVMAAPSNVILETIEDE
ncbi:MAG TPA: MFS transporter, partial [Anaerolineae bacterium]|nr:MFS transporter [Anaerolineae bacterium]